MRAVVTGRAGFLGFHLCEQVLTRGDDVVCVDGLIPREENVATSSGMTFLRQEISESVAVSEAVHTVKLHHRKRVLAADSISGSQS
jgi:dTDP-glucose 4,6-dehydratase